MPIPIDDQPVTIIVSGASGPAGASADASTIAATIHAAADKATPVDADEIPLVDSAAYFGLKRLTWANIKATAKTYFDALYQPLAANLTSWAGIAPASKADANNTALTGSGTFGTLTGDELYIGLVEGATISASTGFVGTINGATFTGPTIDRIYTLPDAAATLLYAGGPLGTPSSGTATNLTGTAAGLTAGNATLAAGLSGASTLATNGAASTPALKFSGVPFAGTGTTSFPLVYINDANATASTTLNTAGTYFGINGDGTQDLINAMKDGSSVFKVDSVGGLTLAGVAGTSFVAGISNGFAGWNATSGYLTYGGFRGAYGGFSGNTWAPWFAVGSGSAYAFYTGADIGSYNLTAAFAYEGTANTVGLYPTTKAAGPTANLKLGSLTASGNLITTPDAQTATTAAVSIATTTTKLTTTAPAQAITLANGTEGQIKIITHVALSGGGTAVLTPATKTGYTTITFAAVTDTVTLQYYTTIGWVILASRGVVIA